MYNFSFNVANTINVYFSTLQLQATQRSRKLTAKRRKMECNYIPRLFSLQMTSTLLTIIDIATSDHDEMIQNNISPLFFPKLEAHHSIQYLHQNLRMMLVDPSPAGAKFVVSHCCSSAEIQ